MSDTKSDIAITELLKGVIRRALRTILGYENIHVWIRYGLILPSKNKPCGALKRPAVFDDNSSSEEDSDGRTAVNTSLKKEAIKRTTMKKTQDVLAKAMMEDPTVFEYDSLYDKMKDDKDKSDPRLTAAKTSKPKYIAALKKTADRRKIEQDIIYERKVQREMEADNYKFGDKDAFVTSAYKKKLAERKILEAELEKEAAVEAANDVTKQENFGKFYQQLLKQKVSSPSDKYGEDKAPDENSRVIGSVNNSSVEIQGDDTDEPVMVPDSASSEHLSDPLPSNENVDSILRTQVETVNSEIVNSSFKPEGIKGNPFAKRTDQIALESARSRYFARQRARQSS